MVENWIVDQSTACNFTVLGMYNFGSVFNFKLLKTDIPQPKKQKKFEKLKSFEKKKKFRLKFR